MFEIKRKRQTKGMNFKSRDRVIGDHDRTFPNKSGIIENRPVI